MLIKPGHLKMPECHYCIISASIVTCYGCETLVDHVEKREVSERKAPVAFECMFWYFIKMMQDAVSFRHM